MKNEKAVSPIVGVMLMLVVTIIIAAVVSAFAGGLVETSQSAPTASVEIDIKNGGDSSDSYFSIKVLGVSEPIHTKNLKLVTSWVTTDRDTGETITGGSTSLVGDSWPTGYGPGVSEWANSTELPDGAKWGNYTLMAGTTLMDSPSDDYSGYAYSGSDTDAMQSILGEDWNNLRAGDIVNVRIIYASSGTVIVSQQVAVEE